MRRPTVAVLLLLGVACGARVATNDAPADGASAPPQTPPPPSSSSSGRDNADDPSSCKGCTCDYRNGSLFCGDVKPGTRCLGFGTGREPPTSCPPGFRLAGTCYPLDCPIDSKTTMYTCCVADCADLGGICLGTLPGCTVTRTTAPDGWGPAVDEIGCGAKSRECLLPIADASAVPTGRCNDEPCFDGFACGPDTAGGSRCTACDATGQACGTIACVSPCVCTNADASVCSCP